MGTHTQRSFKNWADFGISVRRAAETSSPDQRLIYAAAPSTASTEGSGQDGGYAAPPDLRKDVVSVLLAETSLLGRTDRVTTTRGSITIPADASPAWSSMQPTLEPEGAVLGQVKLALASRTVRLSKVQVTVPVSNELWEDAGDGLSAYLRRAVSERLDFAISNHLINGDGVGKPLGVLNSPALIVQTKEGAQQAGTVNYTNLSKLWQRLWSPSKSRAIWVCHSSVEAALQQMVSPVGSPALIYPAESPYGYLFGRPVLVTEAAPVIGTPGDIALVDPLGILSVTREGVVRDDVSIHCWWDLDLAAFRFVVRIGAVPWWSSTVTQKAGGQTVSSAVVLEQR